MNVKKFRNSLCNAELTADVLIFQLKLKFFIRRALDFGLGRHLRDLSLNYMHGLNPTIFQSFEVLKSAGEKPVDRFVIAGDVVAANSIAA